MEVPISPSPLKQTPARYGETDQIMVLELAVVVCIGYYVSDAGSPTRIRTWNTLAAVAVVNKSNSTRERKRSGPAPWTSIV